VFFASGLIEAVSGYKKLTTYLSRHIRHADSSKKSAIYKQTLINPPLPWWERDRVRGIFIVWV